jgi:hypothetical protein
MNLVDFPVWQFTTVKMVISAGVLRCKNSQLKWIRKGKKDDRSWSPG